MFRKVTVILAVIVLLFSIGCQQKSPAPGNTPTGESSSVSPVNKPGDSGNGKVTAADINEARELLNEAVKLKYDKKLKDAVLKCREALKKNPNDMDIYKELANIYKKQNDFSGAIDIYEKAIVIEPENSGLWIEKANTLGSQKKYKEAIEAFKKAIELKPAEKQAYIDMAKAYGQLDDFENCEDTYKKAMEKFPDDFNFPGFYADYWTSRSQEEENEEKKIQYLQQAAELYEESLNRITDKNKPFRPSTLFVLGKTYFEKWQLTKNEDDRKKAIEIFEKYKTEKPGHIYMDKAEKMIEEMEKSRSYW